MAKISLRDDIQLIPVIVDGRRLLLVQDPLRIVEPGFALAMEAVPIIRLLDGTLDLKEMQTVLMRNQGGSLISMESIRNFIDMMDKAYLLSGETFEFRVEKVRLQYHLNADRYPFHTGWAYKGNESPWSELIQTSEAELYPLPEINSEDEIVGIMAPI